MRGLSAEIELALDTIIEGLNYKFFENSVIQEDVVEPERMKSLATSKTDSLKGAKKILKKWADSNNRPSDEKLADYIQQIVDAGDSSISTLRNALKIGINFKELDAHKHATAINSKPVILEAIFDIEDELRELREKLEQGDLSLEEKEFKLGYPERFANGEFCPKDGYYKKRFNEKGDIIIDPKSTEGDKITLMDLGIILPKIPDDTTQILFYDLPKEEQYWRRTEPPRITTTNIHQHNDYILEEYRRRVEGVWFMNNGVPTYLTGHHYFALQYCKMLDDGAYMNYREAQRDLFYFMEGSIVDTNSLGTLLLKSRRTGFTYSALSIILNEATSIKNGKFGMMSKSESDGSEAFAKIAYMLISLPFWLRPIIRGRLDSTKSFFFAQPADNSKESKKAKSIDVSEYLNTSLDYRATRNGSYDSIKLNMYLFDECMSPETKILTPNGFKMLSEVKVGDYVINGLGDKKEILDKVSGRTEMFKIIQPYGKDYVVTGNHELYLRNGYTKSNIFISVNDYLKSSKDKKRILTRVTSSGFLYRNKKLKIEPYILGVWLGDGFTGNPYFIVNTEEDIEIYNYLYEYAKKESFRINEVDRQNKTVRLHLNDDFYVRGIHRNVRHRFKKNLLDLGILKNKRIPKEYMTSSKKQRLELLAGIIDTDGYKQKYSKNAYVIKMSRKELMYDIYRLCKELGLGVSEILHKKSQFNTDIFKIHLTDHDGSIPCKVARKIPSKIKKVKQRGKIKIESIGKGDYIGITIDGKTDEERLLILEDYTLTKNCGKLEKPNDAIIHMGMVRPTLMPNNRVVGKMFAGSTMGGFNQGGEQFISLIGGSHVKDKDPITKQTATGLYLYFIPAQDNMEQFTDLYGKCWKNKPPEGTKNVYGEPIEMGSMDFLLATEEMVKKQGDKAYNEQLRTYPKNMEDAMRDLSEGCIYNMEKLYDQLNHNEKLPEIEKYQVGNFEWEDGIRFSKVIFHPNPRGRFKVAWLPSIVDGTEHLANNVKKVGDRYYPLNGDIVRFGVDPFSVKGSEGSKGGAHAKTMFYPPNGAPSNKFVLEYLFRPPDDTTFFEDMLKSFWYYGAPALIESNRIDLNRYMRNAGCRGFAMNRLDKPKLTPHEQEYGGQPMSGKDMIDSHMNAIGGWIEKYVGRSNMPEVRPVGEMGEMPFNETIMDWLRFNPDKRTKHDATISSGLAIMACQSEKYKRKKVNAKKTDITKIFKKYSTTGNIGRRI